MPDLRKERANKGLCPNCGELAAPYYLCDDCHVRVQIGKFMKAMVNQGVFEVVPDGNRPGARRWRAVSPFRDFDEVRYNGLDLWERAPPRLRGVPADLNKEVLGILARSKSGMTVEDVAVAWVKLRRKPGQTNAASGIVAIMHAEDKRARKMKRNARVHGSKAHA